MYFEACAQLADARPDLRAAVEAVDGLLEKNEGRPITLDFLIDVLDAPRRQLEFIFESLQEADAFQAGVVAFCSEHAQPLNEAGQCDLCDDDQPAATVSKQVIHVPIRQALLEPTAADRDPVRVLISYSHDSPAHAVRVLELSDQLREHGVDCHIDQYTPVPTEGWPLWMQRQIERADYVICVCSEGYQARFKEEVEQDVGRGVAWEANLIRNELYQAKVSNSGKFLTVQFDDYVPELIPAPLQGLTSFTLREFHLEDPGYQNLYRHLTDQPATPITQLGEVVRLQHLRQYSPKSRGTIEKQAELHKQGVSGWRKRWWWPVAVGLVLVLVVVFWPSPPKPSTFSGRVSVYGLPVEEGMVHVFEGNAEEAAEEAAIRNGTFSVSDAESFEHASFGFELTKPVEVSVKNLPFAEETKLFSLVSWTELETAFRRGEGSQFVDRIKAEKKALEIVGQYSNPSIPAVGTRVFLQSASPIVGDDTSAATADAKHLRIECMLQKAPEVLPHWPVVIYGVPISYQDGTNNKVLKIDRAIFGK